MKERKLYQDLWQTLAGFKPMVFMAGPRQAGKTTLARMIAGRFTNHFYFNYDILDNKQALIESPYFYERLNRKDDSTPLIVLDEIHKHHNWKNYLKGVYDRDSRRYQFLVSGSGRLDMYKKGGDSLAGRYLMFHLWPFTLAEMLNRRQPLDDFLKDPLAAASEESNAMRKTWTALSRWSGFPEPFLKGADDFYTLWSRNYLHQLLYEDVRSMVVVQKADQMASLLSLLPSRIGSPIAMDNLARDIGVSFDSVRTWLEVFENFYLIFRLSPWNRRIGRAILKEKKVYLFNFPMIENEGARFENMVAVELLRAVTAWSDAGKGDFSLHYARTKDGHEADFVIARGHQPFLLVEAKLDDDSVGPGLRKIQRCLQTPAVQVVNRRGVFKRLSNDSCRILVISAERWLATLP